jgi:hypothetical protein
VLSDFVAFYPKNRMVVCRAAQKTCTMHMNVLELPES